MKNIKILLFTLVLAIASTAAAKTVLLDKIFLKNLDGHKTEAVHLVLPPGETAITVETDDDKAVFSCQFINSSGIVGLEQNSTTKCWGNVAQSSEDTMTLKITNETDSLVELRVHQMTTSSKKKDSAEDSE